MWAGHALTAASTAQDLRGRGRRARDARHDVVDPGLGRKQHAESTA